MGKTPENSQRNSLVEKISLGEKLAYGGGDLASNLILIITSTYVTFFYTDALGLNAGIVGTIMMVSRLADSFTDVLVGFLVDKTKSKYGKTRPWILYCTLPIAIATVLVFLVPNIGDAGKYIYIAITYNLVVTVLYTAINIPYGALSALMTRDQNQRAVINIFRQSMAQIGALIINSMTLPLVNAFGGSTKQSSWVIVSVGYAVLAAVLFFLCFSKCQERVNVSRKETEKIGFKRGLSLLFHNKYWLMLCAIFICYGCAGTATGVAATYYSKYIIGNENIAGIINSAANIPVIILVPFMAPVIKKFGKRNIAFASSFLGIAGQLLILLNPTSSAWIITCTVVKGIFFAALLGTFFSMVADTIEYGHWHNGTRVEGLLYSSTTFGAKVGAGLASAVILNIIAKAGYDGLAAVQTEAALATIKNMFIFGPLLFLVVMPVLYYFYKLDKIYPQVITELQEKNQ